LGNSRDGVGRRREPMAWLHVGASAARIRPGRRRIRSSYHRICSQTALLSLGLAARCGVPMVTTAAAWRRARGGVGRAVRRRRPLRGAHGGTCAAEAVRAHIGRGDSYVATACGGCRAASPYYGSGAQWWAGAEMAVVQRWLRVRSSVLGGERSGGGGQRRGAWRHGGGAALDGLPWLWSGSA
jgi:hypothetical protein